MIDDDDESRAGHCFVIRLCDFIHNKANESNIHLCSPMKNYMTGLCEFTSSRLVVNNSIRHPNFELKDKQNPGAIFLFDNLWAQLRSILF